jgi:hypothetical protein
MLDVSYIVIVQLFIDVRFKLLVAAMASVQAHNQRQLTNLIEIELLLHTSSLSPSGTFPFGQYYLF